jgi:osmoprotectant transport system ATP-binding protein
VDTVTLGALPGGTPLGQVRAEPIGHSFTAGTDSLRAALDAAVLSPAGLAVAVDGDGSALGVATFDQLRAAIQAADNGRGKQARQVQHAQEGPLP